MDFVYTGGDAVGRTDDIITLTSKFLLSAKSGRRVTNCPICLQKSFIPVYHNQSQTPSFRSFSIMGQSDPEYSEFGTVLADGGDRFAVSAICFDSQEELLWMGNEGVRSHLFFVYIAIAYLQYFCRVTLHRIMVQECKNIPPFKYMQVKWSVKS